MPNGVVDGVALLHRSSGRHDSVVADERGGERPARRPRKSGNPSAGATRARKTTAAAPDDVDGPDAAAPAARSRAPGARRGGSAGAEKAVAKRGAAKKAVVEKLAAKKVAAKKVAAKKVASKKVTAKKVTAKKKVAAKKVTAKKVTAKKVSTKKVAAGKAAVKKVAARKSTAKKAGVAATAAARKAVAERGTGRKAARPLEERARTRRSTPAVRRPIGRLRTPILADLAPPTEDVAEAPAPHQVEQVPPPPAPPEPPADVPAAATPTAEAPSPSPVEAAAKPAPAPAPPSAPPAPAPPSAPKRRRSTRTVVLTVVALVALLVVIAVVVTRVVGPSGVKYDELRPGDCLEKPGDRFVRAERVDCAEPHDLEVFALVTDPAPRDARYPGPEILEREATVACLPQFQTYVGIPFEQSELRFTGYVPTEKNWEADNRLLVCTLSARTGRLTGTVKDSRR